MCATSYTKISSYYLFCLFKIDPLTGPRHIKWSERILFYSTSLHHREDNGSLSGRGETGTHGKFSDPLVQRKSTERVACILGVFLQKWQRRHDYCVFVSSQPPHRWKENRLSSSASIQVSRSVMVLSGCWMIPLNHLNQFYGWLSSFMCYLFPPSDFTNVVKKVLKKWREFFCKTSGSAAYLILIWIKLKKKRQPDLFVDFNKKSSSFFFFFFIETSWALPVFGAL